MPLLFTKKTRKNNKDIKNGTLNKNKIKTFRAKLYQSVYGASTGGSFRTTRQLFF